MCKHKLLLLLLFEALLISARGSADDLRVMSWNVGTLDPNMGYPFEFYTDYKSRFISEKYNAIVDNYEKVIVESPDQHEYIKTFGLDKSLVDIFSEDYVSEIADLSEKARIPGAHKLVEYFKLNLAEINIIDFLNDEDIKAKGIIEAANELSDFVTLQGAPKQKMIDDKKPVLAKRPNAHTCFPLVFVSVRDLFLQWRIHMLEMDVDDNNFKIVNRFKALSMKDRRHAGLTEEEESISQALQILYLVLYDAASVFILNSIGDENLFDWQDVRYDICTNIFSSHASKTDDIIARYANDNDIMLFQDSDRNDPPNGFTFMFPNQNLNSLLRIGLSNAKFNAANFVDVTKQIHGNNFFALRSESDGLILVTMRSNNAPDIFLKDLNQILEYSGETENIGFKLIVGVSSPSLGEHQDLVPGSLKVQLPREPEFYTSCNAKTFLQYRDIPSSRKTIVRKREDFIITNADLLAKKVVVDNTGNRKYEANTVLPNFDFPSYHALVSAVF